MTLIPEPTPPTMRIRRIPLEIVDIAFCVAYIVLGALIGITLIGGPNRYHDTRSVEYIAGLGLRWWIVGAVFLLYAVALTNRRTRVFGWGLGVVLFGYYLLSIIVAGHRGFDVSALGYGAAIAAVLSQISGWLRSMVASEWRG